MAKVQATKKERINKAKRRRRQFTGLVFTALVIIGIATIVSMLAGYVAKLFDDSDEKLNYEKLIRPIVALDPPTFSSITNASPGILVEAAIWAALGDTEDLTKYPREEGMIVLPEIDVAKYAAKMYGPSFQYENKDYQRLDVVYVYRADLKGYLIPITSQSNSYTPVVEKITTSGNTKVLLVAYTRASAVTGELIMDPNARETVKYKEYVMIKGTSGYYLYSIREPENPPEIATTPPS